MELLGEVLAQGKTKWVHQHLRNPDWALLIAKDDITAGDGAKHDVIPDKGRIATRTTCNVFRFLKACQIPVAFEMQGGDDWFIAPKCNMLPYEVVTRREAHGSSLKRAPHLSKGHIFPQLVVEFFLKTSGRRWKEHELPCDDPLMIHDAAAHLIRLYNPANPLAGQEPFLVLNEAEVFTVAREDALMNEMARLARQTFFVLEKAWQLENRRLVDMKVEFGTDPFGKLLLADVVDNDSWRVVEDGAYIDKQVYRDGGDLSDVTRKYQLVAELTSHFALPRQRVILWTDPRGTGIGDKLIEAIDKRSQLSIPSIIVRDSMNGTTSDAMLKLITLTHEVPDTVVLFDLNVDPEYREALSCVISAPVINCIYTHRAITEALNILAVHNPLQYMLARVSLEAGLPGNVAVG